MNFNDLTLPEWLTLLENRHEEEIQLGLDRIKTVAHHLGLLTWDSVVFSVAGTNGKGSTVAVLESLYRTEGYNVGSYTSPHLVYFNERICINQQPISDKELCEAFVAIEKARGSTHLTYFEMTTLAALWYFKQHSLDVIILEVGLGGRLDATNIIDSDLAIITTIDFDHQDYLGGTKEAIGYEKAGILRTHKPYIFADNDPPVTIIEQATLLNAPRIHYSFQEKSDLIEIIPDLATYPPLRKYINPTTQRIHLFKPSINLKAAVAAVIASAAMDSVLPITLNAWDKAMKTVSIKGRQQLIKGDISTLLDVAHNPQAVSSLVDFMKKFPPKGNVHAVFSGLKDKDLRGLINPMIPYVDVWYPAVLSGKRAASEMDLKTVFQAEGYEVDACFNTPWNAYQKAMQQAITNDLIVVYGSFLTVSPIMAHYVGRQKEESQ